MVTRSRRGAYGMVVAAAAFVGPVGCAALLGDFSEGPSTDDGGSGNDADEASREAGADGHDEAAAAPTSEAGGLHHRYTRLAA